MYSSSEFQEELGRKGWAQHRQERLSKIGLSPSEQWNQVIKQLLSNYYRFNGAIVKSKGVQ